MTKIKVVCLSDSHGVYEQIPPPGDILIIAGDVLWNGNVGEYGRFFQWMKRIVDTKQYKKGIYYTPGNHDIYVEDNEFMVKGELLSIGVKTLIGSSAYIRRAEDDNDGDPSSVSPGEDYIHIYGAPWVPLIGREKYWAYEYPRGNALADKWKHIPEGLDILVTHGPPKDILDHIEMASGRISPHWGCYDLRHKLFTMKKPPKYAISGHIHNPVLGKEWFENGIQFYNVAVLGEDYTIEFEPRVFEI